MNRKNLMIGSMVSSVGIGAIVCMTVTLLLTAIVAVLIGTEKIPVSTADYCVLMIVLMSAITGSMVGAGKVSHKRLYASVLIAVSYLLILLSITAMFFEGQYNGVGVTALVIISGSIVAILVDRKGEKRSKKRRIKMGHR